MAEQRVMTSSLAIIKIGGVTCGKMRNIRVTETFRRGDVRGLGEITSQEKPIIGWDGSLSCSFYSIDLKRLGTIDLKKWGLNRSTNDLKTFVNTLLLNDQGVEIYIYKKFAEVIDTTTGLVTSVGEGEYAVIENALIENQNFDISEGSVSGSDASFSYLNPILFASEAV